MHLMRPRHGRMTRNFERPDWGPLIRIAPAHVDEFMWMFEVELEGGLRLHAYKHRETRGYLHLDHGGRAFAYIWEETRPEDDEDGRYEQVDPHWLLGLVLEPRRERGWVRREVISDSRRIRWARSASRHGVPRRSIRFALARCRMRFTEDTLDRDPDEPPERILVLGEDEKGRAIEVMTVQAEDETLLVVHAMRLREDYRLDHEEAQRWR